MTKPHEHEWRMTIHIDQCHAYTSGLVCECGATASSYDERDVKDDPYSMVWMDSNSCSRCAELIAGAKPVHRFEVTA